MMMANDPVAAALHQLKMHDRQHHAPRAVALAVELVQWQPSAEATYVTLLIELRSVHPRIWRQVDVVSTMTLRQFHDQVLCPILMQRRSYHAYAFQRRADEPWLGDPKATSLDMIHLPLYIRALACDKKVMVGSLFEVAGDRAAYVHDLGDWYVAALHNYLQPEPRRYLCLLFLTGGNIQ